MASFLKFLLVFLLTVPCMAQELPDAPKPHHDYVEWSLLATNTTLRLLDAYSTIRDNHCTCTTELILPPFISKHTAVMYTYSMTVVGVDWLLTRELKHHGHRKLARLPYIVDIGVELPALHNFALPTKVKHGTF
jgi:hypothetical protein